MGSSGGEADVGEDADAVGADGAVEEDEAEGESDLSAGFVLPGCAVGEVFSETGGAVLDAGGVVSGTGSGARRSLGGAPICCSGGGAF